MCSSLHLTLESRWNQIILLYYIEYLFYHEYSPDEKNNFWNRSNFASLKIKITIQKMVSDLRKSKRLMNPRDWFVSWFKRKRKRKLNELIKFRISKSAWELQKCKCWKSKVATNMIIAFLHSIPILDMFTFISLFSSWQKRKRPPTQKWQKQKNTRWTFSV